jgi:DNA-binding IclR family transcriptional regulator
MQGLGLLVRSGPRGPFRIGPELVRMSVLLAARVDVPRIARPVIEECSAAIDETVILALYSPQRRQFWAIDAAESSQTIRYIWESLQTWSDLVHGVSGKGILAFLEPAEHDAIIDPLPDPIDGLRPTTKADLRAELDQARDRGFVLSRGERFPGAIGLSAPIRDATGGVIGDLIATWPDNRTDPAKEARAARRVVDAANRVSHAMGYPGHPTPLAGTVERRPRVPVGGTGGMSRPPQLRGADWQGRHGQGADLAALIGRGGRWGRPRRRHQSRVIAVAMSASFPSGSASVHQAGARLS